MSIRKRHFANIVLINGKKHVLMQLRDTKPGVTFQGLWALPGGRIDENESAGEAVRRECEEETGYILKSPKFLKKFKYDFIEENHNPDVVVFYEGYDGKQAITCNEGQKMEFVLVSKLNNPNCFPHHKDFVHEVIEKLKKEKLNG